MSAGDGCNKMNKQAHLQGGCSWVVRQTQHHKKCYANLYGPITDNSAAFKVKWSLMLSVTRSKWLFQLNMKVPEEP